MQLNKIYFPNLNGLRFIAAFMVIIHHLEQVLSIFGLNNSWNNPVILAIGELGVELFFVLSGFLITYLLLCEQHEFKTISIKDFYIRRVLRIWPLYYFIGLIAFFLLPNIQFFNIPIYSDQLIENFNFKLMLYLLFLPNLLLLGFGIIVPYASQSWSVGVEEQFYLIWPLLMKIFKNKLTLFFLIILIYFFMYYFGFRIIKYIIWNNELELIKNVWSGFKIYSMAIGALFSYSLFNKSKILSLLLDSKFYLFSILLLIFLIAFNFKWSFVYNILFGIIILNLASSKAKGLFLENTVMNYLGKISYGLYMYHLISITICIKLFQYFDWLNYYFLLLLSITTVSIILASLSYYMLEKKFILLKNRFSKVISGENAK